MLDLLANPLEQQHLVNEIGLAVVALVRQYVSSWKLLLVR
jgi:hypothetical protein